MADVIRYLLSLNHPENSGFVFFFSLSPGNATFNQLIMMSVCCCSSSFIFFHFQQFTDLCICRSELIVKLRRGARHTHKKEHLVK